MAFKNDLHLRQFGKDLKVLLAKRPENTTELQKKQLETLVALEKRYRKAVIADPMGKRVYEGFVSFICDERRNILVARPFFRVRQTTFTNKISKALKARNTKELSRYHFNFQFIRFIMRFHDWPKDGEIYMLYDQIVALRIEILEMNMPLAINRTGIFWRCASVGHLSYMDFVQIASEGFLSAIDKYVLPYSKVFRSVAIGRMVGNFIAETSETLMHFYPNEKRKLYRANKVVRKHKGVSVDFDSLANEINTGAAREHITTPSEIADLMSAASLISSESGTESEVRAGGILSASESPSILRPDVMVEHMDLMTHLTDAMEELSALEVKLLKLRGISI